MIRWVALVLLCGMGWSSGIGAADRYVVDQSHSTVGFAISHMVLSKTRGSFGEYNASILWDKNPANSSLSGVVKVGSIDTRNTDRDAHLKSPDFFDAAVYPDIQFVSKGIKKTKKPSVYEVTGTLTMKGVAKTVTFPLEVSQAIRDPWGKTRMSFNARFKINRRDFGMNFSKVMDNGGLVVGNDVEVELDIEAIKDAQS